VLARRTASNLEHFFVNLSNEIHERVKPLYLAAISLTHSLFS
jgi:hypothetical protein